MSKKIIFIFLAGALFIAALALFHFIKPSPTQASNPCKKNFYTNNDIVGYFRDVKNDESYYITNDWCVVKAILWWGSVFEHYSPIEQEVNDRYEYIFPEPQVYFGLIPAGFLDAGNNIPRKGTFYTVGLASFGYLINDDPFKNIYGINTPTPPQYIDNKNFKKATPPKGSVADLLMINRMSKLHQIFSTAIAAGACDNIQKQQELDKYCQYFLLRTRGHQPSAYHAFTRSTKATTK